MTKQHFHSPDSGHSNSSAGTYDLAIIGGGASGILLLLHTLKQAQGPFSVVLFNHGYPLAKGVAYSTEDAAHLLNVRAGRMSAYADHPEHFVEWVRLQPEYPAVLGPDTDNDAFIPRYLYGRYLKETFDHTMKNLPTGFQVKIEKVTVTDILKSTNYHLTSSTGIRYSATNVALCTGIEAPSGLPGIKNLPTDERIHINPWMPQLPVIDPEKDILLIGTGLTMVDHVLSLLNSGFKGRIIALSRHGQLPMAHPEQKQSFKKDHQFIPPHDLLSLFSIIRKRIKEHSDPQGWEEPVLEDIRPYTQQLWYRYSAEEKAQFLRHLQHLWSKLRHRIPYPVFLQLDKAVKEQRLLLLGGKLEEVSPKPHGIDISIQKRKAAESVTYSVQRIFNCIGPVLDVAQSTNPLIRSLAQQGYIRNSAARLGPDATPEGKLIDHQGEISEGLFVLGPPMRGVVWEAVAVPEIRVGAKQIATDVLEKTTALLKKTG